jgi:hypothetical protein
MTAVLGVLAGLLQALAGVPYIRDVLGGSTRPHRATWLIWCVLSLIVFLSQRADGARWSLVLVGVQVIGTWLVFLLSLRRGVGGRSPVEIGLLALAGLGVLGWQFSGEPAVATGCVVFADLIAVALMLPKTYRDPMSETLSAYLIGLASVVLSVAAVGSLRPDLLLYPVYLLAADSAVVVLIVTGRRRLRRAVA